MEDAEVVLDVDVRFALRVEEVSEVPGRAEVGCSGIVDVDERRGVCGGEGRDL